jgi:hypothetical protein
MSDPEKPKRGKLSIPASFDDALRAALKVKPPEKPKRKPRTERTVQKPNPRD